MIDLGDAVPLTFCVYDAAGNRANAGSVNVTITLPDGSTASPSITNPEPGVYVAAYVPTVAGDFRVHWIATGTNEAAYFDAFVVNDRSSFISLDDAKAYLRITNSSDDDDLRGFIATATAAAQKWAGVRFATTPITETYDIGSNQSMIILRSPRALSITSVTELGTVLDPSQYKLHDSGELTYRINGYSTTPFAPGISSVTIAYTAGLDPDSRIIAVHAVLQMLSHLWETQRGKNRPVVDAGWDSGMGYTFPNRVIELLEPLSSRRLRMILFALTDAMINKLDAALDCDVYDAFADTQAFNEAQVIVGGSLEDDLTGSAETDWHSMPWGERDEDNKLIVAVLVQNGNATHTEARARCRQIINDIERAFTEDPSLDLSDDPLYSSADPRIGKIDYKVNQGQGTDPGSTWIETILTVHIKAITEQLA